MHLILNIGKNSGLKVAQFLRSNLNTEAKLTYPYLDNAKKLLLEVMNIKGNDFLNYFIGKNIKRVTWDGDNVAAPTHGELFCSDFSSYLADDKNDTAGDYDVYNAGLSVIEKSGPLPDAYARYIIEFDREPKVNEDLNLFVTFQGLANFSSIDQYLSTAVTGGDTSTTNLYNDTTTNGYFDPPLNTNTFTPVSAGAYSYKPWGASGSQSGMRFSTIPQTNYTEVNAIDLPAGHYYLYTMDFFTDNLYSPTISAINVTDVTVLKVEQNYVNNAEHTLVDCLWSINVPNSLANVAIFGIDYLQNGSHKGPESSAHMIVKTS